MSFTLKRILFIFIPYQLIYQIKKKFNLNYFLFGRAVKKIGQFKIDQKNLTASESIPVPDIQEAANGFRNCFKEYKAVDGFLRKYVVKIADCYIEPKYGWGITNAGNKLVFDSISNNAWHESYHPSYLNYRKGRKDATRLKSVISININSNGENNYWHFLHDLLGQVSLALQTLPPDIPFLISSNLSEKAYFKEALIQSKKLASLDWKVRQEGVYFYAEEAWFLQVMPNDGEQFEALLNLFELPHTATEISNRKVFLTRSDKRSRFLRNSGALETICRKYAFETVDTENSTLQEQIKLLSETRWLISIHGAGMTNMIYRSKMPMSVLELLPKDYLQPHYFWLSMTMGFKYFCLVGSNSFVDTSFEVDEQLFEQQIQMMLQA